MQGNVQLGGKVPPAMSMESIKARVPSTIPCHSINGTFKGTFHLHEYLSSTSTSSCYSRLKACVSQVRGACMHAQDAALRHRCLQQAAAAAAAHAMS